MITAHEGDAAAYTWRLANLALGEQARSSLAVLPQQIGPYCVLRMEEPSLGVDLVRMQDM